MKKKIETVNAPAAVGPYSQAIEANGFLYVSGQLPLDPKTNECGSTITEQTEQCFLNAKAIVEEAGYDFQNAVKVTVLLDDINDFAKMNEVYAKHFTSPYPARVCYEVAKLPLGVKVEIDFIVMK